MDAVYVDNAATTKIMQEVLNEMAECAEYYGNPSSSHSLGRKSNELIENARNNIARSINAKPNEIIFSSGGTESNNLAIHGFVDACYRKGSHIITTAIEHASVLSPLGNLYDLGYNVTYLPVDDNGMIDLHQLQNAIRRSTVLISIMFANNEIGTIQPIKAIGEISRRYNICFHTDAVSAYGHCDIDVDELGIDMMSISGHKIYAPKGVGALYVKDNIRLTPMLCGGGQEFGLRSGTQNVNSIIGMGKAVELLDNTERDRDAARLTMLKDKLIAGIIDKIPGVKLNGSGRNSLCNIVNVSFEGVRAENLLIALDSKGIYASSGSACLSGNQRPPHVLTAIGLSDALAYGGVRFSFGRYNTENDVDYILETLTDLVEKLRRDAF